MCVYGCRRFHSDVNCFRVCGKWNEIEKCESLSIVVVSVRPNSNLKNSISVHPKRNNMVDPRRSSVSIERFFILSKRSPQAFFTVYSAGPFLIFSFVCRRFTEQSAIDSPIIHSNGFNWPRNVFCSPQ